MRRRDLAAAERSSAGAKGCSRGWLKVVAVRDRCGPPDPRQGSDRVRLPLAVGRAPGPAAVALPAARDG